MNKVWMIIAIVCAVVAIVFLLQQDTEVAFVIAAIATVAWFLNYRGHAKRSIANEPEDKNDEEHFDLDDHH
jgi:hypothetical protein